MLTVTSPKVFDDVPDFMNHMVAGRWLVVGRQTGREDAVFTLICQDELDTVFACIAKASSIQQYSGPLCLEDFCRRHLVWTKFLHDYLSIGIVTKGHHHD